jgi:MFS family permease
MPDVRINRFISIFPYVYFMIEDFFRNDPSKQGPATIAVHAGMVTSTFAFAEFSSAVAWGRLSHKVGRKPVLLVGLAGTALGMMIFGLAPNLPVALLAGRSTQWVCMANRRCLVQNTEVERMLTAFGMQQYRCHVDHRCRNGHRPRASAYAPCHCGVVSC